MNGRWGRESSEHRACRRVMILEAGCAQGPAASRWPGAGVGKEVPFEGQFGDGEATAGGPGGEGAGARARAQAQTAGSSVERAGSCSGAPERHDSSPLRVLKVIERFHVSETRSRRSVGDGLSRGNGRAPPPPRDRAGLPAAPCGLACSLGPSPGRAAPGRVGPCAAKSLPHSALGSSTFDLRVAPCSLRPRDHPLILPDLGVRGHITLPRTRSDTRVQVLALH